MNECFGSWQATHVNGTRTASDSAVFGVSPKRSTKEHPVAYPVEIPKRCISASTNRDDLVLDHFMGSGTTGVACAQLGRKFIGIEIERKYFDIACERIDNAYRQQRLFA